MSYEDGWAALNLEMPARIPRTEYSAEQHWDLIHAVTGIDVGVDSPESLQQAPAIAFQRAWNYDLFWQTLINHREFGDVRTDMGHAEYMAGGVDRREIAASPFADPESVLAFDPWEAFGAIDRADTVRRFEDDYGASAHVRPFGVSMTGIYVTLSLRLHRPLRLGTAACWPPARTRCASETRQPLRRRGCSNTSTPWRRPTCRSSWCMTTWSGPPAPIFRPAWYREYVFPNYKRYVQPLLESGKKVLFCSDGDFTAFVDDIAQAGFTGFVFEPLTDLRLVVERYGRTHVIVGNVDTRVLLFGDRSAIRAEVERCIDLGKECPGYFMAVGNHIPPNTPVENALYYNEVYEELSRR